MLTFLLQIRNRCETIAPYSLLQSAVGFRDHVAPASFLIEGEDVEKTKVGDAVAENGVSHWNAIGVIQTDSVKNEDYEQMGLSETDVGTPLQEHVSSTCLAGVHQAASFVHLSLGKLKSVDLDAVLARVPETVESHYISETAVQPLVCKRPGTSSLMDQLAQLSVEQSQESLQVEPKMMRYGMFSQLHADLGTVQEKDTMVEKSSCTSVTEKVDMKIKTEEAERETVVMDLRQDRNKFAVCTQS